jgi:hypothetical protein
MSTIYQTPKFEKWLSLYADNSNAITFSNATQSALIAYNTTNQNMAAVIGSKNIRKYKMLASMVAEKEGFDFATLIKVGIKKVLEGNYNDWEKFMKQIGYFD